MTHEKQDVRKCLSTFSDCLFLFVCLFLLQQQNLISFQVFVLLSSLYFLSSVSVCACVCTWSVCAGLLGVEFGFEWSSWLQFGFGELRQVGHHWLFVHTGINDLLRSDHLHIRTTTHTHTHTQFRFVINQSVLYMNIPKSRFGLPVWTWRLTNDE